MADIMFEKFRVNSFQICNTATLSMYSTGRVSGLVVESGEALTSTVPVFEGYALPHAMIGLECAGQDVTNSLIEQLQASGVSEAIDYPDSIRELKEQMCSVSLNYGFDMQQVEDPISPEERSYELPGGKIIQVNHKQRYKSTEILFNPQINNMDKDGVV
jgi:actin